MPEGTSPTSSRSGDFDDSTGTDSGTTKRVLIVLGVHRSGTSALAGALTALGFHPGENLLPAVAGVNNSGFFEDQRVVDLNTKLLTAAGRDWSWPGPLPDGWQHNATVTAIQPEIRAYIEEHQHHELWLLKDPRLCQLLPVWLEAFAACGIRPHVLLSYRHAVEVSHSLQARDNMSTTLAEQLWVSHLLASEQASRGQQRLLIRYSDLVADSATTLSAIADWLELQPGKERLAEAIAFVSAGERHQRASALSNPTHPLAIELDALFDSLTTASANSLDTPDIREQLDALHARATEGGSDLQPVIDAQASAYRALEADFTEALKQLETQRSASTAHLENSAASARAAQDQYAALQDAVAQNSKLQQRLAEQQQDHNEFRDRATRVLGDLVLPPAQSISREQDSNDYKGVINLLVENNSHTRVIRYLREHLPTNECKVLEIGCSEGYFGAALKADGHTVWGIETNDIAAASAISVLDLVFRDSIEAFLLAEEHLEDRFDAIIFGDVLEHLLDPARILREVSSRLMPNGVIVASVPNVAHERVRMMLLEGRWEYSATGIMDNTHLHFFTRDTLVQLFNAANLNIKRFSSIDIEGDAVQIDVTPQTRELFEKHITDRERSVFQFVVMVEPATVATEVTTHNEAFLLSKQHHVLCLPPAPSSSLYSIRIGDPLERQNQLYGGETRMAPYGAPNSSDVEWADTIVLQREVDAQQLKLVKHLQKLGKRVVFDIDDYLIDVPHYLSVHEHCRNMRPRLETMLKTVDAVSVSTEPLRDKLLAYNPNVVITPNYAWTSHEPIKQYAFVQTPDAPVAEAEAEVETNADDSKEERRIRVIVASSDSVRVDFLVATLEEIAQHNDVELIGIGPPGDFLREVGLPIATAPIMPHEQFKAYLASRDNTIALIPLDDNEFNNCKSAIKYFDYALAGVPCVCSDVEPYRSAVEHQATGLLCPDVTADWVSAIRSLLDSPELRNRLATSAHARVSAAHNLNLTATAWQNLFQATAFPPPDLSYQQEVRRLAAASADQTYRTPVDLVRGTIRHLLRPASWQSAVRIYKTEGIAGLKKKWKLVF